MKWPPANLHLRGLFNTMDDIPFSMMIQGTHNLKEIYDLKPSKVIIVESAVIEKERDYIQNAMNQLQNALDDAMKTRGLQLYESYYDIVEKAIVINLNWGT